MVLVDGTERSLTPSESARILIRPASASVEILDNDGQYNNLCISQCWMPCICDLQ